MQRFALWVRRSTGNARHRAVLVAAPAGFDAMWVHWYEWRFLGEAPTRRTSVDLKSLAMGQNGGPWHPALQVLPAARGARRQAAPCPGRCAPPRGRLSPAPGRRTGRTRRRRRAADTLSGRPDSHTVAERSNPLPPPQSAMFLAIYIHRRLGLTLDLTDENPAPPTGRHPRRTGL